tara:strand:- start:762 stop:1388 length:627 start_codon:yes stop_codon:yes gene_type:complete
MKLVILSDNHTNYDFETPDGDILIHCGDFTYHGKPSEIEKFRDYLKEQPHRHKLFIFGNHEKIDREVRYWIDYLEDGTGATCIHEKAICINGINFFGSSYTPKFMNWAFMHTKSARKRYWSNMNEDMDVLVTHGPPKGIMGKIENGTEIGCEYLLDFVERVKPNYHFFGHNHAGAGVQTNGDTLFVNAAILTEKYEMCKPPMIVHIGE